MRTNNPLTDNDYVTAHECRYWGELKFDGGIAWILIRLPDHLRLDAGKCVQFTDGYVKEDDAYANELCRWIYQNIWDISPTPCSGPGRYFQRSAYIKVVGKRCLVTMDFGWDV